MNNSFRFLDVFFVSKLFPLLLFIVIRYLTFLIFILLSLFSNSLPNIIDFYSIIDFNLLLYINSFYSHSLQDNNAFYSIKSFNFNSLQDNNAFYSINSLYSDKTIFEAIRRFHSKIKSRGTDCNNIIFLRC